MTNPLPPPTDHSIPARDGYPLAATLFPAEAGARELVVIHSATAVPRRFYRHFATGLAGAGFSALTYDYRGIGDSRPPSLRGFPATMTDWALLDMAGVVDWVGKELAPDRLYFVGHSFGGQTAGLLDNVGSLAGMVTLSAQSGYWRLQGGKQKLAVAFHVHVTLPLLAKLLGYVPWSRFSAAEDLPGPAALQWSRWCRHPRYLLGDDSLPLDRYSRFAAPVLAYSFGDDDWGTARSVDAMMRAYPHLERRHVEPAEVGLDAIGHFGYFKPSAGALWRQAIDWLADRG